MRILKSLALCNLVCLAAAQTATGAVIDFENLRHGVRVINQYQAQGVIFNNATAVDYSLGIFPILGFAHSGTKAIETCFAQEQCSTPVRMDFTEPQALVKVWVGYSERLSVTRTVELRAFNASGSLVDRKTVQLLPSNEPQAIQNPLEIALPDAQITRAEVGFSPSSLFTNSLAIDDIEFEVPVAISSFTVSPSIIFPPDSVELCWETLNADQVEISPGVGRVDPTGCITISPSETTDYVVRATNPVSVASELLTVTVLTDNFLTIRPERSSVSLTAEAEQIVVAIELDSALQPLEGSGTLRLGFQADGGIPRPDDPDPALALSSAFFSIQPGEISRVVLAVGKVAGRVSITANDISIDEQPVSPPDPPTASITIERGPPVLTRACWADRDGTTVAIRVEGFSPTRELSRGRFNFTPAPQVRLETSQLERDVVDDFADYYQGSDEVFRFEQDFVIENGDIAAIGSASVSLQNTLGSSPLDVEPTCN